MSPSLVYTHSGHHIFVPCTNLHIPPLSHGYDEATFFGIASCQEIHWYEALILLGLYGLYCLLMTVNTQAQALVTRMCCRGRARRERARRL